MGKAASFVCLSKREKKGHVLWSKITLHKPKRKIVKKNQACKTIFFSNGLELQNKLQKTDTKNEISCVTTKKKEIL